MKNKIAGVLAGMMLLAGMAAPVMAVDVTTAGTAGNADVVLTVEAATFSVTVPMNLPITVDALGNVTTATDAKIINKSHGAVAVKNLEISPAAGWEVVGFDTDMTKEKVGSQKLGAKLNKEVTDNTGAISFNALNFPKMDGMNDTDTDELGITYDAKLPAQKTAITAGTKVADMIFTIGWDE